MNNRQIQHLLSYLGYYGGEIDGKLGPQSSAAARAFQRDYGGLSVDGRPGPETQKKLKQAIAEDWQRPAAGSDDGAWWVQIKHFKRSDKGIACPCGRCGGFPVEPSKELMLTADKVRNHFDQRMIPSSTVRCKAHNDELPGSSKNSRHLTGRAMDFTVEFVPAAEVLAFVKTLPEIKYAYIIKNGPYVHMDIGA